MINKFIDDYLFLDIQYYSPFFINNKIYRTLFHYIKSIKCLSHFDSEDLRKISNIDKIIIESYKKQTRGNWYETRNINMYEGLKAKFCNPILRNKLKQTNNKQIIYINNNDLYWGINDNGEGQNNYGKLIMKLRTKFIIDK